MRRRNLAKLLVASWSLGRSFAAVAQPSGRIYRLGVLSTGPAFSRESKDFEGLIGALKDRGYALGGNLAVVAHTAGADRVLLADMARELKADPGIDVVLTAGFPAAKAALDAGLPKIVATNTGDPVSTHLIKSMAEPGGTMTGISDDAAGLSVKRLSLLAELLPGLRRVAMLWNRDDLGMSTRYQASAIAAQAMGVGVQALGVRAPDDFNGVFEAMDKERPDAILMVSDALTTLNRKRVIDYAAARRIPAIYETELVVRDGGLMSYGADRAELIERAAAQIDRLFRGADPAGLPFELPTRYRFVINLKTAQSLGLSIPDTLIARADDTVE